MCGIAGIYFLHQPAELAMVRGMCDRIRHRGPDDEGFHIDGGCGIGMRRLSIIDLSTGHQPISNEDGTVWVVFNGEIYNYQELREDLIARGHRFATHSDTETLVHLYEEEGPTGVSKLRGMFAYAIWDAPRRRLFIARDRFGKKPLYYAVTSRGLFFGSELKCFRDVDLPFDLDRDALRLYFQFGYVPEPASPFRAIRKLPPGAWMSFDEEGTLDIQRYWRLPVPADSAPQGMRRTDARERLRELFDESVRIRLMSDVPLGAFLSGGIDSSSVVASMALQSRDPVKTFSIGFEESTFNELPYARMVARKYGTDHHEIIVKPDCVDLVQRIVHHLDEPFADSSAIPTFIVSEFAARHVKVVLTGDGGDELFAGYESFFQLEKLRYLDSIPASVKRALLRISEWLPYSAYGKNYLHMIGQPTALGRYFEFNHTPYSLRRELLAPEWMLPADAGFLNGVFADCLPCHEADVLTQALYFEATAKLTNDMLVKVDRMSMANSLEVRCPLLDHKLAEFAALLPHSWKMDNGTGKSIFLESVGERLPPELLKRQKMGFGVPLPIWFRGPLREFLWDHLTHGRASEKGIVSAPFVQHLFEEHQSGRRDNNGRLWMLLVFELWLRDWESPTFATSRREPQRPVGVPIAGGMSSGKRPAL